MELSRLVQPRNPLFWLMMVLNGLSSVLTYFLHAYDLPLATGLVVGGFALGNAVFGIRIALRLMRDDPRGATTVADKGRQFAGPK